MPKTAVSTVMTNSAPFAWRTRWIMKAPMRAPRPKAPSRKP